MAVSWRKAFLLQMEEAVPWPAVEQIVSPVYSGFNCRFPLSVMLRVTSMQYWFGYDPKEMAEALKTEPELCQFSGLVGASDLPNETEIRAYARSMVRSGLIQPIMDVLPSSLSQPLLMERILRNAGFRNNREIVD